MDSFKPSGNFVARIMAEVQSYEKEKGHEIARHGMLLNSKAMISILSAGGILLGVLNVIRFAFILISPAWCL
jgi:hypothetical protein